MIKKLFIYFTVTIMSLLICQSFVAAESFSYTFDKEKADEDWLFQGDTKYSVEETGIKSTAYDAKMECIFNRVGFYNYSRISVDLNNYSTGVGNKLCIYLNYKDKNNMYYVSVGGARTGNPVELYRVKDGTAVSIGSYDNYSINYSASKFIFEYDDGSITVRIKKGDTVIDAISVTDTTFPSGKIGIATKNAFGTFYNIEMEGNAKTEMMVEETNIENGEKDVLIDTDFTALFNYDIDADSLSYEKIKVLENGEALDSDLYSFSASEKILTVSFDELKTNSKYKIMLSGISAVGGEKVMESSFEIEFQTSKGADYVKYVYNPDSAEYDWEMSAATNVSITDAGIAAVNYKSHYVNLIGYEWRDDFSFSVRITNASNSVSNKSYISFLYTDTNNRYVMTVEGSPAGNNFNNIRLESITGGVATPLGETSYNAKTSAAVFTVTYTNGHINIKGTKSGVETVLFDIDDTSHTKGTISFGVTNNNATFAEISAEGYADVCNIKIVDCNIETGDVGIDTDADIKYVFDRSVDKDTIAKSSIEIYAGEALLDESEYTLKYNTDGTEMTISFVNGMLEKTTYRIVLTEGVVASVGKYRLEKTESELIFDTIRPKLELNATAVCDSHTVTSLTDCAGKTVNFTLKPRNNQNVSQTYAITVCAVDKDGKTVGAIYFMGTLDALQSDLVLSGNINIPLDLIDGKIEYYFWDGFSAMNVLLPSSEI